MASSRQFSRSELAQNRMLLFGLPDGIALRWALGIMWKKWWSAEWDYPYDCLRVRWE